METDGLIKFLEKFVSERRVELFDRVAARRTRYITVVLEDIFQPHNASAVLRTCECFGIQDVHIIENSNQYSVNPDVALGSDKWLNMTTYNRSDHNTVEAFDNLRSKGYRIVATTPHKDDVTLDQFDLSKGKTALLFGTELKGLTDVAIENADEYIMIPMYGFTESFNISVSVSIILHHLTAKLFRSDLDWRLSDMEKQDLKLDWLRKTIKSSEQLEREFLKP